MCEIVTVSGGVPGASAVEAGGRRLSQPYCRDHLARAGDPKAQEAEEPMADGVSTSIVVQRQQRAAEQAKWKNRTASAEDSI